MAYFNQTELLARGWTLRRITVFLGKPDFLYQGRAPGFRNSATPNNGKAWRKERVIDAERDGALTSELPKPTKRPPVES